MPEPIAWIILTLVWLWGTYSMGDDSTHTFDDDNSWKYRINKGILLQLVIVSIVGIAILIAVALATVLGAF